jgi:hypothetical protein
MDPSKLEDWKNLAELAFYVVAIASACAAVYTFRRNSALERTRWISSLYEKFYEGTALKRVREILDSSPSSDQIFALINRPGGSDFTDYLNFFEHIAYLQETKQVGKRDVEAIFDYYLRCLKRHPEVWEFITNPENGYEKLRALLENLS